VDEQNNYIQTLEKSIDWTSLVGVNIPVSEVELYHRVERIEPTLLANGTLRVQTQLKLFAVVSNEKEQKHLFNPAKIYTNDMDINMFFNLNTDIRREDILSVDHQVLVKNYVPRPDKIIVSGTLTVTIRYMIHPVLEGSVKRFSNGTPVGGITINVRRINSEEIVSTTSTGANGKYYFNNLPPGVYLVEAFTNPDKPEQKVSVITTRDTVNFVLHQ
jgi:hypothetical protein